MFEGLYIHIPFCVTKCIYCDFNSTDYKLSQANDFLTALDKDLARIHPIAPKTIFIGGGTPTSLSVKQMDRFCKSVSKWVQLEQVQEFTIEANPGTVDRLKLLRLRELGVNRISFGVQSFHGDTLKFLGRIHNATQIYESIALAKETGFSNISIDLIFGVPGQTTARLAQDLKEALSLETQHLSIYNLIYERGTKLNQLRYQNKVTPVAEDLELQMFEQIWETLLANGYQQYEISNYCRPNFECQHNLIYWKLGTYQAVGPGAHGFDGIRRFSLVKSIQKYIEKLTQHEPAKSPVVFSEKITNEQRLGELLMLGLRLTDGLSEEEFYQKTQKDFGIFQTAIEFLRGQDWIRSDPKRIQLTLAGQKVSDGIISYLLNHQQSETNIQEDVVPLSFTPS